MKEENIELANESQPSIFENKGSYGGLLELISFG